MTTLTLVLTAVGSVLLLLFLVMKARMHAFLALMVVSIGAGLFSGMPLIKIAETMEKGMGGTLGFLAIVVALGAMFGKILHETGAVDQIAVKMLKSFGHSRAHYAIGLAGLICALPLFFEVAIVLLISVAFSMARHTGTNLVKLVIPLFAGVAAAAAFLVPGPAPMLLASQMHADFGWMILIGLCAAIPGMLIAGPLWVKLVCKTEAPATQEAFLNEHCDDSKTRDLPGLGVTLLTIALPLLLMVGKSFAAGLPHESTAFSVISFMGTPLIALSIAVVFAYWALGLRRGLTMADLLAYTQKSFPPLASILLIIGAGGAFNGILIDSGVGSALSASLTQLNMNPIVLAWLVAGLMHFAVGSATVAMISAAGMVLPMLGAHPTVSKEIICIAIGAGAMGWTHVTDSAFWVVKEYLGVSLTDALKTFTTATVLASTFALGLTLLLSPFV